MSTTSADVLGFVAETIGSTCEVTSVASIADARAALAAQSFDLVVLDLMLSQASGLDLLPELRDRDGNALPVILYSARAANGQCRAGAGGADQIAHVDRSPHPHLAQARGPTPRAGAAKQGSCMSSLRVLHVDDEPDIREVVEMSLGLDPEFTIKSCASGADALSASDAWPPDLILLDVMMPVMDGPTTLKHLRERPETTHTPVVFMTARAQAREIELFVSLGAVGVIPKPFDPMTLAQSVKAYVRPSKASLAALRSGFLQRASSDAAALAPYRAALAPDGHSLPAVEQVKSIAHGLAGAGGIFGFPAISEKSAALARAADAMLEGHRRALRGRAGARRTARADRAGCVLRARGASGALALCRSGDRAATGVRAAPTDGFNVITTPGHPFGSGPPSARSRRRSASAPTTVAIVPFLWQASPADPGIGRGKDMSDDELRSAIREARALGFSVVVKPHVWVPESWAGAVAPRSEADWQAWFAGYRSALMHIAEIAAEENADALAIGTELAKTTHRTEWFELIARRAPHSRARSSMSPTMSRRRKLVPFWPRSMPSA